jgi:integrase
MSLRLVRRKGSTAWYIRGTVRSQACFESTGTDDKATAEAIRIQREARLLNDSVYGKKATVTFAEAACSYLEAGGSARFLGEGLEGKWTGLIGHFYSTPLHRIGQDELNKAADTLYPNTTNQTRNRQCYTPFIAVWNHAVANKWADFRQWRRPRKAKGTNVIGLKPTRAGTKPVAYERAAEFVLALGPAAAMVMTTLFYTGMRPIEVFSLHSDWVNIGGRWIALPSSKTGEPRGVPIHEFLVPMLSALKEREGIMFRTPRGGPYPVREAISGQMKTAIKHARERTGIRDVSAYTARHTVSTQLVINGVHPHIKDQILGHAVDDMSRHYTDVPQAPLIQAINKLPVIRAWRDAPWMIDPVGWTNRRIEAVENVRRRATA